MLYMYIKDRGHMVCTYVCMGIGGTWCVRMYVWEYEACGLYVWEYEACGLYVWE